MADTSEILPTRAPMLSVLISPPDLHFALILWVPTFTESTMKGKKETKLSKTYREHLPSFHEETFFQSWD
jgi:hypothetical protein